jgi:hypothetical protein
MKRTLFTIFPLAALVLAGCAGDDSGGSINPPPPPPPPGKNKQIGVWATTSIPARSAWEQVDRLARPVVNEVFATFANNRHKVNNEISPVNDSRELEGDIQKFMDEVFSFAPEGRRSQATVDVMKAVLVPDVLKVDLGVSSSSAAYLGFETGGATGSKFGGRALTDDVVDISLGVVFGTTISDLKLAPADGKDIPTLTSDNVGPGGKRFTNSFPYLGDPR